MLSIIIHVCINHFNDTGNNLGISEIDLIIIITIIIQLSIHYEWEVNAIKTAIKSPPNI